MKKPKSEEPTNKPLDALAGTYWEDPKTGKRWWSDGTRAPRDPILDLILRERKRKKGWLAAWDQPTPPIS
jgi:hypothetical protein